MCLLLAEAHVLIIKWKSGSRVKKMETVMKRTCQAKGKMVPCSDIDGGERISN